MEILLKTEQKPEAAAVLQLLDKMTMNEQRELLAFMQGVKFAQFSARQSGLETSSA